jgi:tRNA(Ile)-lysidine synthetase-like protein
MGIRPGFDRVETLCAPSRQIVAVTPDSHICRDSEGNLQKNEPRLDDFNTEQVAISIGDTSGQAQFNGLKLRWQTAPKSAVAPGRPPSLPQCEWFDSERVGDSVILRHWRPGDRFHPIGMSNPIKLQDFFTNQRVPREKRRRLIVAATADGEIFWVEGVRIGEHFRLDGNTRRVLRWDWTR